MQPRHLNIAQFCWQDYGGAGTAALRLHDGLRTIGVNSNFYIHNMLRWRTGTVLLSSSGDQAAPKAGSKFIAPEWKTFNARNTDIISQYPHRPQGLEIFSDTWAATHLAQIPELNRADIIHLHWIAGTVNLPREVSFLQGKKIVWTLHDMNAFTGGCHYSAGCEKYRQRCGQCPQLGSNQVHDLAHTIWERKQKAYDQLDITIVTPSQWLADCVLKSSLLSKFPVCVIPYGLPLNTFKLQSQSQIRKTFQIPQDRFLILFGADSVLTRRKGLMYLVRALEILKATTFAANISLVVFGHHGRAVVEHLGFPTIGFDYVEEEAELAAIYSMADVAVIPSLEDNLPNTVLESLACGTPVVGFDVGGIPDMVTHQVTGYLARPEDVAGLAQGIAWVLSQQQNNRHALRLQCRESTLTRYSLPRQARRYVRLYTELLESRSEREQ